MERRTGELLEKGKEIYGSLRIRTKIMVIFFVVTLSVVVTVSVFLYSRAAKLVEEEAEDTIIGLLDQTAISAGNVMVRVEDICFRMYTNQSLRNIFQTRTEKYSYWQQMEDYYTLTDIYNANMADKYIEGISLFFKVYGTYVDMQYACFSMEEAISMPWYAEVVSRKGTHWVSYINPYKKSDESGYTISCIRTVMSSQDDLGYIEVKLNQNIILEILQRMKGSVHGDVYILTEEGHVLFSSDESSNDTKFCFWDLLKDMNENDERIRSITGTIGSGQKLIRSQEGDLIFAAVVPEKVFRTRAAEFIPFVVMLAVLELIIAMAVARALSANITGRIAELSRFMQHVSIEEDVMAVERDNDEITELVRSYNRMLRMTRNSITEVYETKLEKKETELLLLQAQINPHFLYNTLDSINWMANKRKAYDISKMTRLLANFFRQSLNKGENIILLRDEFTHVQTYLEIIQMRYEEEIEVHYELEESILSQRTVKFILQPIVENAVVHGLMERDVAGGLLFIGGRRKGEKIVISIQDNGVGIEPEKLSLLLNKEKHFEGKGGYGLKNVDARIKLSYGEEYGLVIQSARGKGTLVEVWLPWQEEDMHP